MAYASDLQSAENRPMRAVKSGSPFDAVSYAVETVQKLTLRVDALRNRLVGHAGPPDASQDPAEMRAGVFGSVHDDADRIRRMCDAAHDALGAIESALPDRPPNATSSRIG